MSERIIIPDTELDGFERESGGEGMLMHMFYIHKQYKICMPIGLNGHLGSGIRDSTLVFCQYKHKNPCHGGHEIHNLGRHFLCHLYDTLSFSGPCQALEKTIF